MRWRNKLFIIYTEEEKIKKRKEDNRTFVEKMKYKYVHLRNKKWKKDMYIWTLPSIERKGKVWTEEKKRKNEKSNRKEQKLKLVAV